MPFKGKIPTPKFDVMEVIETDYFSPKRYGKIIKVDICLGLQANDTKIKYLIEGLNEWILEEYILRVFKSAEPEPTEKT